MGRRSVVPHHEHPPTTGEGAFLAGMGIVGWIVYEYYKHQHAVPPKPVVKTITKTVVQTHTQYVLPHFTGGDFVALAIVAAVVCIAVVALSRRGT